ncbi:MAG TPA: hypothetical protein VJN22_01980 [Candidatus Eremiobacteraceae bacterium]|nr:hypothetical protein [Candidatus Eremiobacteraceae bacterium]
MRRTLAAAVIAVTLGVNLGGCSTPVDTGSNIPAQSQPLVTVLALLGLGIAITAFHHHSETHPPGNQKVPQTPISVIPLRLSNATPIDLTLDPLQAGQFGALLAGSGGSASVFDLGDINSDSVTSQYTLPAGYQPTAVAIDSGTTHQEWFVNSNGQIDGCAIGPTTCIPSPAPFSDTLASGGTRFIAADAQHIFIARDDGASTVTWSSFDFVGTQVASGSYTYTAGGNKGLYAKDAVVANGSSISQYLLFHADGTSHEVQLTSPPTTSPGPTMNPVPDVSGNATITGADVFGYVGSPTTGLYSIARYGAAGSDPLAYTIMALTLVAFNGVPNPGIAHSFSVPLNNLHEDSAGVYGLDPGGNVVTFNVF